MESRGGQHSVQFTDEIDDFEEFMDGQKGDMDDNMEDQTFEGRQKQGDLSEDEQSEKKILKLYDQPEDRDNKKEFKKFDDKERIKQIFTNMDELQQERFETFRQSNFDEKKMKKILGSSGKMNKNITAVIKSVTKIYVGELVEEAKTIQLEDMALEGVDICQPVEIGLIHPSHLCEARRRLLERGQLVRDKPKQMFIRR